MALGLILEALAVAVEVVELAMLFFLARLCVVAALLVLSRRFRGREEGVVV